MKKSIILFSFFLVLGFVLPMSLSAQGVPSPKKSPNHVEKRKQVIKKTPVKHPVQKHQPASLSRKEIPMRKIKATPARNTKKAYLVAPDNRKRSAAKPGRAVRTQKTIKAQQMKK